MRNKIIRLLSIVAAVIILVSSLCINSYATDFTDYSGEKITLAEPDNTWTKITVSTPAEFIKLAEKCKIDVNSEKMYVEITEDISFNGEDFKPIPYFKGIFNGNGHTISGITCLNKAEPVGLIAIIGQGGLVKNLKVTGALQPAENCNNIGAIAGENRGIIYKCSFEGVVTGNNYVGGIAGSNSATGKIVNCKVTGAVRGDNMVGGITGNNAGSVIKCENNAYVNTESVDNGVDIASLDLEFTLDFAKLTSQVSSTMQDMGGIAGYSSGTVYLCQNKGKIGYNHQGYNVGGIVGRSSGYVFKCTNDAYVCGRKDIGGIVGQMEPYIQVTESEAVFKTLNNQFKEMQDLMEITRKHASAAGADASEHIDNILGKLDDAQSSASDISDILTDTGELDEDAAGDKADSAGQYIKDNINKDSLSKDDINKKKEDVNRNQDELDSSLSDINKELDELNNTYKGYSKELDADLDRINAKYSEINDTVASVKDINFEIQDTSAIDFDNIILGAVRECSNEGEIEGDLNAGGIIGVMGEESSVDPEDEISLSLDAETHKEYEYKAVLTDCVNHGYVHIKRNYAGGVVARAEIGYIRECENYGRVSAEGSYVGGIAAENKIHIESCYSKSVLSGIRHVGGITGVGVDESADGEASLVSDSRSFVTIEDAVKFYGAVSGSPEGVYVGNMFTSDSLYGLGTYSAEGGAYPVSYEELVKGDDVPDEFTELYVKFMAEDVLLKSMEVDYKCRLDESEYPSIPPKAGCFARWDIENINSVEHDTYINAVYTKYVESITSGDTRMSGRHIFYAEGDFSDEDILVATRLGDDELSVSDHGIDIFGNSFYHRSLDEYWSIKIPDDGREVHTIRYLPTGVSRKTPEIFILENGEFNRVELTEVGSYYSFDTTEEEIELAVISITPVYYTFVITVVCAAAALIVIILIISVNRRVIKTIKDKEANEDKENSGEDTAPEETEGVITVDSIISGNKTANDKALSDDSDIEMIDAAEPEEKPVNKYLMPDDDEPVKKVKKPRNKKRIRRIILRILNLIFLAAAVTLTAYLAKNPEIVNERIAHFVAARTALSDICFDADITLKTGNDELHTESTVYTVKNNEDVFTCVETSGIALYRCGDRVYLENGKAFEVTDLVPDFDSVYKMLPGLIDGSSITAERVDGGTRRTFWMSGANAGNIIKNVAGEYTSMISSVEHVQVVILSSNWKIKTMDIKGSLILKDGRRASVECSMVMKERAEEAGIPAAVLQAAAENSKAVKITPDMINLFYAFGRFNNEDPAMCDILLSATGSVISLDTDLSWFRCREKGEWINCVTRNGVSVYYNNNGACTAKGVSLSDAQKESVNIAKLIDRAYDIALEGNATVIHEQEKTVYKFEVDGDDLEEILLTLAPEAQSINRTLNSGMIKVLVKDDKIAEISVSVSGNVSYTLLNKAFSISLKAVPSTAKTSSDYVIPADVAEALIRK